VLLTVPVESGMLDIMETLITLAEYGDLLASDESEKADLHREAAGLLLQYNQIAPSKMRTKEEWHNIIESYVIQGLMEDPVFRDRLIQDLTAENYAQLRNKKES
jgi:hypothetical protein